MTQFKHKVQLCVYILIHIHCHDALLNSAPNKAWTGCYCEVDLKTEIFFFFKCLPEFKDSKGILQICFVVMLRDDIISNSFLELRF